MNPDALPLVTIANPATGSAHTVNRAIAFGGTANDPEDGDLTASIAWSSSLDGSIGTGGSFSTSTLSIGTHTITARATDLAGGTGTAEIDITVNPDALPLVTIANPATGSAHTVNRAIDFNGTANDPEDGDLTASIAWSSSLDGDIGTGASFSTSALSIGSHTITASATDLAGGTGTAEIDITVNPDALPLVTIASPATGSQHTINRAIVFGGTANDPEDGDLTATIAWSSSLDGSIGTGASISISALSLGTHTITASATDLAGGTGTAEIDITVNPDALPLVTIANPASGSEHTETYDVLFSGTASDPEDGDLTATIAWSSSLDGDIGTGASFSTSTLSLGTHTITASATDLAGGTGIAEIEVITKLNTAPLVTITKPLTGSGITHGYSVNFRASAADAEDGNISPELIWYSDIDGIFGTSGSVTTSALSEGNHTITASAADTRGLSGSAQLSFSVNENFPPTVTILAPEDQSSFIVGQSVDFVGTTGDDNYLLESHGSVSPLGNQIVFRSNWDDVGGPIDAYVVVLDGTPIVDTDPYVTPALPRPAYLQPITDPVFGQTVVRVTDAGQPIQNSTLDPSVVDQNWALESGHGYSSRVAWNADQTLLMLQKGVDGNVFLDGATFEPLFRRTSPGNIRWHPTNSSTMLFVHSADHCLGAYAPISDTILFERCFAGYDSFSWSDPGKGKPSVDGDIIPIRARRTDDNHWVAFLYHIGSDTVSVEIDMTAYVEEGDAPDFTMSPLGDTIIINGCIIDHQGPCDAQVAIDVATNTELWRILSRHDPGHGDELVDGQGEQWRVGLAKSGTFEGNVIKRNFRTGQAEPLIPYAGSHTSTRGIHGARPTAVVSFHEPDAPLRAEIVGVCTDGSCLERYAHTHRIAEEEDATLTANLAWTSNLDGPIGTGASFSTGTLSQGSHIITASVTDLGGATGSAEIGLTIEGSGVTITESRVSASSDDAEERVTGSMKLTSSDLEMTFDKGGDQWVGLRFTNVQIPAGATITDAFVQFQADESDTVVTTLVVHGEAHADSAPFVDVPGDISGRPRTVAVVNWAPAAWATAGEAGIDQRTPNLAPIIQEIVNSAGWSIGNALVIIIEGSGERVAESFDGNSDAASLLHIKYQ